MPSDVGEVVNYIRAMKYGLQRLDTLPLSLRLIREIHEILLTDVRGATKQPGEFRSSQNWIGPGGHVVHYPVQGGRMMNFVGTLEGATWPGPPYRADATREECAAAFSGWHEDVLAMIAHAPSVTRWALCGRRFLDTWTRGRATLLGDACHPTLPFLAQGAVHTLEDAVVLSRCLEKHGIADGLGRYDALRRPRTYQMMRGAADNTSRFHNEALRTEASAQAFVDREWQAQAISDRYDWLFSYRADAVEV